MSRSVIRSKSAWRDITMRSALAILGGYAFTYAFTAALARLLPLSAADALVVATLPAFLVYTIALLWAFAARDLRRVCCGVLLAVPLAVIGFWPQLQERIG